MADPKFIGRSENLEKKIEELNDKSLRGPRGTVVKSDVRADEETSSNLRKMLNQATGVATEVEAQKTEAAKIERGVEEAKDATEDNKKNLRELKKDRLADLEREVAILMDRMNMLDNLEVATGAVNGQAAWDILSNLEGRGYNRKSKSPSGWTLYGEYNGPFSAYRKNDTTITVRGGIVIGGYDVLEELFDADPQIGDEEDVASFSNGLNYVVLELLVDTSDGTFATLGAGGSWNYQVYTDPQDLDSATVWNELICIVDYDSGKIKRVYQRWDAGDMGIVVSYDVTSAGSVNRTYYATRAIRGGDQ